MTLQLIGTFPVSALNIGLATSPAVLAADVAVLAEEIAKLTTSLELQLSITADFPPGPELGAAFLAALDVTSLASVLNPTNWVSASAGANADLVLDLAFVDLQIAAIEPLILEFRIGLGSAGLYGWTYAGNAVGFGETLQADVAAGFADGVLPNTQIDALVIATNSFTSWGSFGNGFSIGTSGDEDFGVQTTEQRLRFIGALDGGFWSIGLEALISGFELLLIGLRGSKAAIEASIDLSLGFNIPNPIPIIEAGLSIDLTAALGNFVNVQTDLTGQIDLITAKIDASLELSGNITVDLSASGLTFWSYSGPAAGLGSELATELASGLPDAGEGPSGAVYGLVLASADASNWNDFGRVFKT